MKRSTHNVQGPPGKAKTTSSGALALNRTGTTTRPFDRLRVTTLGEPRIVAPGSFLLRSEGEGRRRGRAHPRAVQRRRSTGGTLRREDFPPSLKAEALRRTRRGQGCPRQLSRRALRFGGQVGAARGFSKTMCFCERTPS